MKIDNWLVNETIATSVEQLWVALNDPTGADQMHSGLRDHGPRLRRTAYKVENAAFASPAVGGSFEGEIFRCRTKVGAKGSASIKVVGRWARSATG